MHTSYLSYSYKLLSDARFPIRVHVNGICSREKKEIREGRKQNVRKADPLKGISMNGLHSARDFPFPFYSFSSQGVSFCSTVSEDNVNLGLIILINYFENKII